MEEKPEFLKANPLLPAPGDVYLYFDKILQIPKKKGQFYESDRKKAKRFAIQGKMSKETAQEFVKTRYNVLKQHVERYPGELGVDYHVLLNYLFIREGEHSVKYSKLIYNILKDLIQIIKSSIPEGTASNEDVENCRFWANYEELFGEFWYMPDIDNETSRIIYPTQKVLNKLVEFCPNGENDIINNDSSNKESIDDTIEFRKQFRKWKNNGANISRKSIEILCSLNIKYKFKDSWYSMSVDERKEWVQSQIPMEIPIIPPDYPKELIPETPSTDEIFNNHFDFYERHFALKEEQFCENLKHALIRAQAVTYFIKDMKQKNDLLVIKKILDLFYELYQ